MSIEIANGKDFICRKDLVGIKNFLLKKLTYIAVRRKVLE